MTDRQAKLRTLCPMRVLGGRFYDYFGVLYRVAIRDGMTYWSRRKQLWVSSYSFSLKDILAHGKEVFEVDAMLKLMTKRRGRK